MSPSRDCLQLRPASRREPSQRRRPPECKRRRSAGPVRSTDWPCYRVRNRLPSSGTSTTSRAARAELYGVLAPVAVSATLNVAPWQESFAALLIEIAFARSRFKLPFTAPLLAGTSQPAPLLVCGEVTLTLAPVLQALWPPSTVTAPSETE